MSKADLLVERGANRLEVLARKAAAKGGFTAKLADELAEDAAFLRKLKPSLIKARAKGRAPIANVPHRARPRWHRRDPNRSRRLVSAGANRTRSSSRVSRLPPASRSQK